MRVFLCVIVMANVVAAGVGCSSNDHTPTPASQTDSGADGTAAEVSSDGSTPDSGAAEAAPLSADCQRLYDCCVGPAAQTPQFCTGLVGQNICGVWLQSYAMAGIQCS
jgi:hypothetical protein